MWEKTSVISRAGYALFKDKVWGSHTISMPSIDPMVWEKCHDEEWIKNRGDLAAKVFLTWYLILKDKEQSFSLYNHIRNALSWMVQSIGSDDTISSDTIDAPYWI